jgi:Fe-S cluster assembly protein SufD
VYFINVTTEVKVGPNANIEHYKVQQESSKAFHIATLQVDQQRDSTFTSHSVSLGAQLARNDINAYMGDEGATCNLYGLYVTDGRQHTDFHTRIDHAQPHCTSNEFYKGILDGHSRAVFNGQVHVHPDAQKSDAQQSNNNLLLSKNAEVDTKPQLEIYADDVTAAHGATVGQLDENMMFYLRSRGIDYNSAHALLVYGFAHSVIEKMSLEPLQKHLEGVLVSRIPNAAQFSDMV